MAAAGATKGKRGGRAPTVDCRFYLAGACTRGMEGLQRGPTRGALTLFHTCLAVLVCGVRGSHGLLFCVQAPPARFVTIPCGAQAHERSPRRAGIAVSASHVAAAG